MRVHKWDTVKLTYSGQPVEGRRGPAQILPWCSKWIDRSPIPNDECVGWFERGLFEIGKLTSKVANVGWFKRVKTHDHSNGGLVSGHLLKITSIKYQDKSIKSKKYDSSN